MMDSDKEQIAMLKVEIAELQDQVQEAEEAHRKATTEKNRAEDYAREARIETERLTRRIAELDSLVSSDGRLVRQENDRLKQAVQEQRDLLWKVRQFLIATHGDTPRLECLLWGWSRFSVPRAIERLGLSVLDPTGRIRLIAEVHNLHNKYSLDFANNLRCSNYQYFKVEENQT